MAFGDFKALADVARTYRIRHRFEPFLQLRARPVDERFDNELTFSMQNLAVRASEAAICEFLIAPVLREVWRVYSDALLLFSHVPLGTAPPLMGTPDYFVTRRGPLGVLVEEEPYLVIVEAKKDDFDVGWGQCLAAMLAAQGLNSAPSGAVYGCVSNGTLWQFARLEGHDLAQDTRDFVMSGLASLFAALNDVFARARDQALAVTSKENTS